MPHIYLKAGSALLVRPYSLFLCISFYCNELTYGLFYGYDISDSLFFFFFFFLCPYQDIVQARPSRFPISSQELFSILDDASEKTFLSGTAISMQRYIFDGEAGKVGLESKNLVACTSFLVEQKLVTFLVFLFHLFNVIGFTLFNYI